MLNWKPSNLFCFQIPGGSTPSEHVAELQRSVESYLSQCHDNYNMAGICEVSYISSKNSNLLPESESYCDRALQDVMSQICSTLFYYPSIRQCAQLQTFIRKCVHTAWSLVSQVNDGQWAPETNIQSDDRAPPTALSTRRGSTGRGCTWGTTPVTRPAPRWGHHNDMTMMMIMMLSLSRCGHTSGLRCSELARSSARRWWSPKHLREVFEIEI